MTQNALHLFDAFGIELEYMIVDESLNILPICDTLLTAAAGELTGEVEFGAVSWSNELALHVVEMKVTEPVTDLDAIAELFQSNVNRANQLLRQWDARLMPTAMHPWMDPSNEMVLWPHDHSPVYEAFDRIFNCSGHGWANLQSTHWNLPFGGDEEFAKLHAAIRVILPLLPALMASSPIYDSAQHGILDCRLEVYQHNSKRIPSIAGHVVPEPVFSEQAYEREIYQVMYRDIAAYDPDGILQHIWLNARGAIARFDRGAIEIRVLDIQECPAIDIALGSFIVSTIQLLVEQTWSSFEQQSSIDTELLAQTFRSAIQYGFDAAAPEQLAAAFGAPRARTIRDVWRSILDALANPPMPTALSKDAIATVERVMLDGNLSQRILRSLDDDFAPNSLARVYRRLCNCLQDGKPFVS